MIVRLKPDISSSTKPRSLTIGKDYVVLGINADMIRILDDQNDPVLYDDSLFEVVDNAVPSDWVIEYDADGDRYANPRHFPACLWEDFHDGKKEAIQLVQEYLRRIGLT